MVIISIKKKPSDLIKSIDKAIDLLEVLSKSDSSLGMTEISNILDFPKSTVARILSTLEYRKFIKQDITTKKYKIGLKIFELGSSIFNDLEIRPIVRPHLKELVKDLDETAHLVIYNQGDVVYIDKVDTTHPIRQYSKIGRSAPVHCSAVGKVILAYKPEDVVDEIIKKKGLKKYTDNTITEYRELKKHLKKIKKRGYAVDNCEIQEELRCVAAPVFNYSGKVIAAISVSGPVSRLTKEDINIFAKKVKKTCMEISSQLGYLYSKNRAAKGRK
ncbi:MAG: IclR family transcriptional regulator [bacterium]